MKFCDKCGIKLEDGVADCLICRNIPLSDQKVSLSSTIGDLQMNSESNSKADFQNFSYSETFPDLAQTNEPPQFARLVVVKGGTQGREFPITNEICNIGRCHAAQHL